MKPTSTFQRVAAALLLLAVPFLLVILSYPFHDLLALWNTNYSSKFTGDRFAQIHIGMSRSAVVELLGVPLKTEALTNYPVWALRDEAVRRFYGRDTLLQIETLWFSRPKRGADYDLVSVWIGPSTNVIQHDRWITD